MTTSETNLLDTNIQGIKDPKKDIGIQKNKKTPFGQEVSVI